MYNNYCTIHLQFILYSCCCAQRGDNICSQDTVQECALPFLIDFVYKINQCKHFTQEDFGKFKVQDTSYGIFYEKNSSEAEKSIASDLACRFLTFKPFLFIVIIRGKLTLLISCLPLLRQNMIFNMSSMEQKRLCRILYHVSLPPRPFFSTVKPMSFQ